MTLDQLLLFARARLRALHHIERVVSVPEPLRAEGADPAARAVGTRHG